MMRWPWRRLWRCDRMADDGPDTGMAAARSARRRAEHERRKVQDQREEVTALADTLRRIRQENHLLEILLGSMRDGGDRA